MQGKGVNCMGMVIRWILYLQWGSHTQPVPSSCSTSCNAPAVEREPLEKWTVTRQTDKQTDTIMAAQAACCWALMHALIGYRDCKVQSADFPAV